MFKINKYNNIIKNNINLIIISISIIMLGLSYIFVPLYQIFCQIYGIGGIIKKINEEKIINNINEYKKSINKIKYIYINFNVDNKSNLPWILKPSNDIFKIKVYPGDIILTFYQVQNLSNETITGIATYNIIPIKAGIYLNKIQCFCFEEQRLKGKELIELPILFYIDKDIIKDVKMNDIKNIILSYTFHKTNN